MWGGRMKVTIEHLIDKEGKIKVSDLRKFLKEHIDTMDKYPIQSSRFATTSVYDARDFVKQVFFWKWDKEKAHFVEVEE